MYFGIGFFCCCYYFLFCFLAVRSPSGKNYKPVIQTNITEYDSNVFKVSLAFTICSSHTDPHNSDRKHFSAK